VRFCKKGEGAKALAEGKYFTPSKLPAGRSRFGAHKGISTSAEVDLRNFLKKVS
jgi:hypothetical protein